MTLAETFASLSDQLQQEIVLQWFGNQLFMLANYDEENEIEKGARLRDIATLRTHPLQLALPKDKQVSNERLFKKLEQLIEAKARNGRA